MTWCSSSDPYYTYREKGYHKALLLRETSNLEIFIAACTKVEGEAVLCSYLKEDGVADGTRTHDNRDHNPGLYQLSYSHH